MTDLKAQKRLAADILGVGKNRVRFDPEAQSEIADAITRDDVRELIEDGTIEAKTATGNSRGRARARQKKRSYGHQKGHGTRKGKSGGRQNEKDNWQSKIRAQRRELRELRDEAEIDRSQYRELYEMASGGEFDSVADLHRHISDEYGEQ
ncbi:50S ribosomal protein L19e [Natronomonas sp.]|uniref:50S ribosomal protein L19e n=1 Tax=Natronomonas sp. TaxID=2184060 RepID=UPI00261C9FDD|nr:50S ribosomal protein L19e [Natronomonas sp.]